MASKAKSKVGEEITLVPTTELLKVPDSTVRRATGLSDAARVTCARIRTVTEVVTDEQTRVLGMLTQTDYSGVSVSVVSSQLRINGERSPRGPVPKLGEHTTQVVADLSRPLPSTPQGSTTERGHRPLLTNDGVKLVD
jgi:crotonobetainyl-CoA:carnitine CoA-transferase CaiB-like acyl-CoA transferase